MRRLLAIKTIGRPILRRMKGAKRRRANHSLSRPACRWCLLVHGLQLAMLFARSLRQQKIAINGELGAVVHATPKSRVRPECRNLFSCMLHDFSRWTSQGVVPVGLEEKR